MDSQDYEVLQDGSTKTKCSNSPAVMYLIRDFEESFLLRWAFILCVLIKKKKRKERKEEKKDSFVQGL